MERPVVASLRDGKAQARLAPRVCRAGLLIGLGAVAENDIKPGALDVSVRLDSEPRTVTRYLRFAQHNIWKHSYLYPFGFS